MEMFYISSIHYGNHWLPVAFVHLKHVICLRKGIFKVLFYFNLNRHTCLVATYYMDSTALAPRLTEASKSNRTWLYRKIFLGVSGIDRSKEIYNP